MMTETADPNARSLLESARRAESDGNIDAALRAYRHITDNYARTPEAHAAADAIARRISNPAPQPTVVYPQRQPPLRPPAPHYAQMHPVPQPLAPASGHIVQKPHDNPNPAHPVTREHPAKFIPRYRFGRLIAHIAGLTGITALLAAIFAAALNLGATFSFITSPALAHLLVGWPVIATTTALALFLILLSQMARAAFDAADAARANVNH